MNIIFLDIDGVLNSVDSAVAFAEFPNINEVDALDPVSVLLLKQLCEKTDAKIVISSTWRKLYTVDDFRAIFAKYDWDDFPIIGVTTSWNHYTNKRGYQIQDWLDGNSNWTNYVIHDDDSDMLDSQVDHFVHVSNISGFRAKHLCAALRIFGKPDEQLETQVNWVKEP